MAYAPETSQSATTAAAIEGATAGLGEDASWRWPEERWRKRYDHISFGQSRI